MKCRISDVTLFQKGFAFKSKDYKEKGVRIVRVGNLNKNDYSDENSLFIDPELSKSYEKYELLTNDIIISTVGSWPNNPASVVGKVSIIPEKINGSLLNQNAVRIRGNKKVDQQFLGYVLRDNAFKNYIIGTAQGSASQASITLADIANYEFELPDNVCQKRIVEILSSLDNKIELNNKINDNLQQQATTLFEEWLKSCDDEVYINDLADNILDYTPLRSDKVVLVNSSDVTRGRFEHHILSDNKDLKGHFKKRFKKFDILYSEIRPRNGHYAYCQFEPENYIASTRLMIIRSKHDMISSSLLYQYLLSKKVFDEFTLKTESRSGTFPQGNYQDMAAIRVPYSKKEMQTQISSYLDSIYNEIWCNEKENIRLSELRDTLLPKLMSGEIDVSNVKLDL